MPMTIVRTTVGAQAAATALAGRLVDAGAACVHVTVTASTYQWQGKRVAEREWMVEARVPRRKAAAALAVMREGHPYDLPLVESWTVRVNAEYAAWALGARRSAAGLGPARRVRG